jgi:glycosyltransferase involved in cell wall biosynthesis
VLISFLMPVHKVPVEYLRQAIESMRNQSSPNWELCIVDDFSSYPEIIDLLASYERIDSRIKVGVNSAQSGISNASNAALQMASGEFIGLLDHDDLLDKKSVEIITSAIASNPEVKIFYSDEVKVTSENSVISTNIKPSFSPELLTCTMYYGHLLILEKELIESIGGFNSQFDGAQDYDLALRATFEAGYAERIPHQLYAWRAIEGSTAKSLDNKIWAIQKAESVINEYAKRFPGVIVHEGLLPGTFRLSYKIQHIKNLEIIILASCGQKELNDGCQISNVINCVMYLRSKVPKSLQLNISVFTEFEYDQDLKNYFDANDIKLIYTRANSNLGLVSSINALIKESSSEYFLMLEDSIELFDESYFNDFLGLISQDGIGCVGGRVSNVDGSIFCAGIQVDMVKGAKSIFQGHPKEVLEYQGLAHKIRNCTALHRASFCFSRKTWVACGGFDETYQNDFFEIDFCLRAIKINLRNVYTPFSPSKKIDNKDYLNDYNYDDFNYFIEKNYIDLEDRFFTKQMEFHSSNPSLSK